MKVVIFLTLISISSCQLKERYYISADRNYKGWVYLLKSTDSVKQNKFYPDSVGIVYIPERLFNSNVEFILGIKDSVLENQPFQLYDITYYDYGRRKTTYCKFYFPFTTNLQKTKSYKYKDEMLREFEYYYESNVIDRNRLSSK